MARELPVIACTLEPDALDARRETWAALMGAALRSREETARGVRLAFDPSVEERLHELAALERDCCAFAMWTVTGGGESVLLDVETQPESVPVVRAMFAAAPA